MKTIVSALLTVLALFFFEQRSRAANLRDLIPSLYGGNGITLGTNSGHQAHFSQESSGALSQLNNQLGSGFGVLPFNSSAGNFEFSFNSDLGTFVNITDTLGPIFAERAPTLGKGKWNISFYGTFFDYNSLNGQSVRDLHVQALHDIDTTGAGGDPSGPNNPGVRTGFEFDSLDIKLNVDASVRIFSTAASYGVTDKLDVSVLIPMVSVDMDVHSHYTLIVSPQNPIPTIHNTNVTAGAEQPDDHKKGTATGLGDVVLGAKYQFYKSPAVELAGAFLAKLASGDENDFLGTGDTTLRPFLVASRTFRGIAGTPLNLTPHINLGYQFNVDNSDFSSLEYIVGFDAGTRRITLATEFLGGHSHEGENRYDVAVGLKWNPYKQLVLTGNVILPINDAGLRSDIITTFGIGVSF
jgi:Putative MetA-pathway of phenol degradation